MIYVSGYVSTQDFVEHVKGLCILDPLELNQLVNYIDPQQTGALRFKEFSSKIYPGMTKTDANGQ